MKRSHSSSGEAFFLDLNLVGIGVVVDFHEPCGFGVASLGESCLSIGYGLLQFGAVLVGGFGKCFLSIGESILGIFNAAVVVVDVNAFVVDAHSFGEEVEADVVAVEHYFNGLVAGSPGEPDEAAELEAYGVAEEAAVIVGVSQQSPVLAAVHAHELLLFAKFEAVGFLFKVGPSVVATAADLKRERFGFGAESGEFSAHRVEPVGGAEIILFRCDGSFVLGVDVQHRKRA